MRHNNITKVISLVGSVTAILMSASSAEAGTYYVAKSGKDGNPGTLAAPWPTITQAANTLVAGDTVLIRAGTYAERVTPKNSGRASKVITYSAYPGEAPVIDGATLSIDSAEGLIHIDGKSYIKISGLTVKNVGPYNTARGIGVYNSSYITIADNHTYNTMSSGIGVISSTNITIDGNEVQLAVNGGTEECITLSNVDTYEVKNNHVFNRTATSNGGEGICPKEQSSNGKIHHNIVNGLNRSAIYVGAWDKYQQNVAVYDNIVYDNAGGIDVDSEAGGTTEKVQIYNNLVYNNEAGISIRAGGGTAAVHPVKDIKIFNNTVYHNGKTWGGGIALMNSAAENVVIVNNIVSQNLTWQILNEASGSGLLIDHNLVDGFTGNEDGEVRGTNSVEGSPKFVNAAGDNFHLLSGSPAIDAGSASVSSLVSADFDGNARPQGSGFDLGAFEFGAPGRDAALQADASVREASADDGTSGPATDAAGASDAAAQTKDTKSSSDAKRSETLDSGCGCGAAPSPMSGGWMAVLLAAITLGLHWRPSRRR